jgi:hypothetical protein
MGILGLEDDDFWSNPDKTRDDVIHSLIQTRKFGATIDAPSTADIAARRMLPIAVIHVAQEPELLHHSFDNEAILVAARLEDRATLVAPLTEGVPFKPVAGGRANCIMASMQIVDAFTRLDLSIKPANYIFGVILRDRMSNRVEVGVGQQRLGYHDDEVAKFLDAQAPPEPPSVWPPPARPFPDYERRSDSPALPDQPGIELAAPRVVVFGRNQAVLRLSYRLPVRKRDYVRRRHYPDQPPLPAAVIPITLLINGSRDPGPVVLAMHVPVEERAIDRGVAVGHVSLNLFDYPPLGRHEETLFVWAFCGELMAGPTLVGIVDEGSLPGRY